MSLVVAILLTLLGPALIGLFLPGALESRRVWLYQRGRVDEMLRDIGDLQQRQDPVSQMRLGQLHTQLRTFYPEEFRDQYYLRMLFVGAGAICLVAAGAVFLIRRRVRA